MTANVKVEEIGDLRILACGVNGQRVGIVLTGLPVEYHEWALSKIPQAFDAVYRNAYAAGVRDAQDRIRAALGIDE